MSDTSKHPCQHECGVESIHEICICADCGEPFDPKSSHFLPVADHVPDAGKGDKGE